MKQASRSGVFVIALLFASTPTVLQTAAAQQTGQSGASAAQTSPASSASGGQSAAPATSTTGAPSLSGVLSDDLFRVDVVRLSAGMPASRIIGRNVENDAGEKIGDVNDLIVNPGDKIVYAILGVGGFLGIGERSVAVPFELLSSKADSRGFVLAGATKEALARLPEFRYRDR